MDRLRRESLETVLLAVVAALAAAAVVLTEEKERASENLVAVSRKIMSFPIDNMQQATPFLAIRGLVGVLILFLFLVKDRAVSDRFDEKAWQSEDPDRTGGSIVFWLVVDR